MLNIEEVYNDYLIKQNKSREVLDTGLFSASTSGSCIRKQYYNSNHFKQDDIDSRVRRLLRLGTIVHKDLQDAVEYYVGIDGVKTNPLDWYKIYSEHKVQIPKFNVVGHLDLAIETVDNLKVIDFKTVASYKWRKKFGRGVNKDTTTDNNYKMQLATYTMALLDEVDVEEYEMSLMWYNKDTSAFKEVIVDNSWMVQAKVYWEMVNDKLNEVSKELINGGNMEDKLIPGKTFGVPMENWECRYCWYKQHCPGV
tara:strand:- start:206 stop:964 length:759 start_codon:yes stop_codon:yes gene_type:complete